MKIQSIEARLKKMDRERERLSKRLETSKAKFFGAIPAKYGYKSIDALINALAPYGSPGLRSRINGANGGSAPTRSARAVTRVAAKKRGAPSRYTEQQKAAVKAAVKKGDKTVAEMAKEHRVAEYSIIDWKKKWGLVKHRKKAPAKKK